MADTFSLAEMCIRDRECMGASIDAFYYCPHPPEHGIGPYKKECSCRKPGTGRFEEAAQRFEVDKAHSFMIGDKLLDVEAGNNYGLTTILVGTGYGSVHTFRA